MENKNGASVFRCAITEFVNLGKMTKRFYICTCNENVLANIIPSFAK